MPKDYLAMRKKEPGDKEDHGIKGQKWGIRRTPAQLASAIKARAQKGHPVTPTKKAEKVLSDSTKKGMYKPQSPPAGESSPARYARLQAQAKAGKASEMSEADLKFFNARTEALSKVAKLNEQKPGWLATTVKQVVQTTAQQQLQNVATTAANEFIGKRVSEQIVKAAAKKK